MEIVHKLENAVLYVCTTALILGLYYMSESFHSFWGLIMMLSITSSIKKIK